MILFSPPSHEVPILWMKNYGLEWLRKLLKITEWRRRDSLLGLTPERLIFLLHQCWFPQTGDSLFPWNIWCEGAWKKTGRRWVCRGMERCVWVMVREGGVIWLCYFQRTFLQKTIPSSHVLRSQELERQGGVQWGCNGSEARVFYFILFFYS